MVTLEDLFVLLPCARVYKSVDELGQNFFKLQSYFVTHFLYVVSEWGKHELPAELFWEEINFIGSNIKAVRWRGCFLCAGFLCFTICGSSLAHYVGTLRLELEIVIVISLY